MRFSATVLQSGLCWSGSGCSRQLFIICSINLANTYFCPLIVDRNNIFIFLDGNRTIFSGSSNDFSTLYFKGECCYNGIAIRAASSVKKYLPSGTFSSFVLINSSVVQIMLSLVCVRTFPSVNMILLRSMV